MRKFVLRKALGAVFAALLGAGLLSGCSNEKKDLAGGTEAESTIAITLQIELAGSPAAYARVRALPEDFLSDGRLAEWKETDEKGFVEIPMEPGAYTIEARHVDGTSAAGAVHSYALDADSSKIDTIKLGELSSIEGYVMLGDSMPVVRIAGLDRYVIPDSTGHFVIDSLPSGSFEVQFSNPHEAGSAKVVSTTGDTLYVDCSDSTVDVVKPVDAATSEYPEGDWSKHSALLAQADGYAKGVLGAGGITDSTGKISKAEGEICIVTTTEDYVIVEDTTNVDSAGVAATTAVIAPGSLRECAY